MRRPRARGFRGNYLVLTSVPIKFKLELVSIPKTSSGSDFHPAHGITVASNNYNMINATQSNSCNATISTAIVKKQDFLLRQTFTAMSPEGISGPENNLCMMCSSFVLVQCISRPGCFAANVTKVGDPSDMVALYVFHYISRLSFFSTHFTC